MNQKNFLFSATNNKGFTLVYDIIKTRPGTNISVRLVEILELSGDSILESKAIKHILCSFDEFFFNFKSHDFVFHDRFSTVQDFLGGCINRLGDITYNFAAKDAISDSLFSGNLDVMKPVIGDRWWDAYVFCRCSQVAALCNLSIDDVSFNVYRSCIIAGADELNNLSVLKSFIGFINDAPDTFVFGKVEMDFLIDIV